MKKRKEYPPVDPSNDELMVAEGLRVPPIITKGYNIKDKSFNLNQKQISNMAKLGISTVTQTGHKLTEKEVLHILRRNTKKKDVFNIVDYLDRTLKFNLKSIQQIKT